MNGDGQRLLTILCAFVLSGLFIVSSFWILPENCYLVETRQTGFLCDGIDINKLSQPCPICRDEKTRKTAQVVFGFGIVVFFLPLAVYALRKRN